LNAELRDRTDAPSDTAEVPVPSVAGAPARGPRGLARGDDRDADPTRNLLRDVVGGGHEGRDHGLVGLAYIMLARQLHRTRRVSGLLVITAITLSVRCLTWALHQTPFTYSRCRWPKRSGSGRCLSSAWLFAAPCWSAWPETSPPPWAIACPPQAPATGSTPIVRVAAVYLGSATTSAVFLLTLNIHWFLLFHQASSWTWVGFGLLVTVVYARRHGSELLHLATTGNERHVAV